MSFSVRRNPLVNLEDDLDLSFSRFSISQDVRSSAEASDNVNSCMDEIRIENRLNHITLTSQTKNKIKDGKNPKPTPIKHNILKVFDCSLKSANKIAEGGIVPVNFEKHNKKLGGNKIKKTKLHPVQGLNLQPVNISQPFNEEPQLTNNCKNESTIIDINDSSPSKPFNTIETNDSNTETKRGDSQSKINNHRSSSVESIENEDPLAQLRSQLSKIKLEGVFKKDKCLEETTKRLEKCRKECKDLQLVDVLDICATNLKAQESNRNKKYVYEKITIMMTEIISDAIELEFVEWDAIKQAKSGAQLMAYVREVLLLIPRPLNENNETPLKLFDDIVWDFAVPQIEVAINSWNPRRPQEMLNFLDLWDPIFSDEMLSNVHNHLQIKLEKSLLEWDPIADGMFLEIWICPWTEILGERTISFHPIIIRKLGNALIDLEAEDFDLKIIMKSGLWILNKRNTQAFVVGHVLPILVRYLKNMEFSLDQNFSLLKRVTDWSDCTPRTLMAKALAENFFPKLIRTLASWIVSEKVEMSRAGPWLAGWLNAIPKELKKDTLIKQCIVDVVNLAMHGITRYQQQQQSPEVEVQLKSEASS